MIAHVHSWVCWRQRVGVRGETGLQLTERRTDNRIDVPSEDQIVVVEVVSSAEAVKILVR